MNRKDEMEPYEVEEAPRDAPSNAIKFGRWLALELKKRKINQEDIALAVGVSASYISALVNASAHPTTGKPRKPAADITERIAEFLWKTPITVPDLESEPLGSEEQYINRALLRAGHAPLSIYDHTGNPEDFPDESPVTYSQAKRLLQEMELSLVEKLTKEIRGKSTRNG